MQTLHDKAVAAFWKEVDKLADERATYRSLIAFFLTKLPAWAVDRATGWVKEWSKDD